jgi:MATE family multidrug resistance protein
MRFYQQEIKEIFRLALPVSIGQVGHILMGITDSLMVGRVGAESLAASSLVNGLVWNIIVFGVGLTIAITPITAIEIGKGKKAECGVILRQSLIVNTLFAILLAFIVYWAALLLPFLKQEPGVTTAAFSYAQIIAYSIIPFMIFQTYRQFIEGLSFMKPAMYVALAANIVNVFVNWLLIFGNWGFPAMGLDGAGYATFFSRLFMAAALIIYVLNAQSLKPYDPGLRFKRLDISIMKEVIKVGIPTGFQYFFEIGAFAVSAIMIGWLGAIQLAAHQIALSLAAFSFMVVLGISSAASVRVGNAYGAGNAEDIKKAGYSSIFMAVIVMSFFGLFFVTLRNYLPHLFIQEPEVVSITSGLIVIAAFFQISDGVQAVGLGALRGFKDVKVPTMVTLIAYWFITLPIGYFLGFKMGYGVNGVWYGFLIGLTAAALMHLFRFRYQTKRSAHR